MKESENGKKSFNYELVKRILFFTITAVFTAAVIYAVLILIAKFDVFPLSDKAKELILFFEGREDPPSPERDKMFDILHTEGESGDNYEKADMSPNILAYLETLKEPDVFFRESITTYYSDEKTKSFTHRIYKNGDKVRIETESDGYSRTVIHSNGDTYIRYPNTGEEVLYRNDESFSYLAETGIRAVSDFFTADNKMDELVSFTRSPSGSLMNIVFSSPSTKLKEEYKISLHYEIVSSAYIYSGNTLVYTLTTPQFVADSPMAEGLFAIPYRDNEEQNNK